MFFRAVFSSILVASGLGACGASPVPHVTQPHVVAVHDRYPDATAAYLEEGRARFIEACSGCHSLPLPTSRKAHEWPPIVDAMSNRAKLDPPRRRAIEAYLVAVGAR